MRHRRGHADRQRGLALLLPHGLPVQLHRTHGGQGGRRRDPPRMFAACHLLNACSSQVYSNTPETINLIIEVFVEVAHKQICYLGEVGNRRACATQTQQWKMENEPESRVCAEQVDEAVRGLPDAAAGLLQEQPVQEAKRRGGRGGPVPRPAAHHGAAHQPAVQRVHRL